jgi:hypothetical protein
VELRLDDFANAFKRKMEIAAEIKDFSDGKPIVIYECVSETNFFDFYQKKSVSSVDQFGPLCFSGRKTSGQNNSKIFGSTTDVYASTIDSVSNMIRTCVFELSGDASVFTNISSKPGMDCNIGPFIHRKLDRGLIPNEVKVSGDVLPAYDNRPFPNVALEVAYNTKI